MEAREVAQGGNKTEGWQKPAEAKWVEITTEATTGSSGWLTVEYGELRITADAGYPVGSLSTLLREMCTAC